MIDSYFIVKTVLFLFFLRCYFIAPIKADEGFILQILCGVVLLLFVTMLHNRKLCIKENMLSVKNIFIVSFLVVYFQAPLDYILGYDVNLEWFYDFDILCASIAFSALCLSVFILGYSICEYRNMNENKPITNDRFIFKHINLFVLLGWLLLLIFTIYEGPNFFVGGYASADDGTTIGNPNSARIFNYLILCLQAVVIMIVWNSMQKPIFKWTVKTYIGQFPIIFLLLHFGVIILWLCAGGRAVSLNLILFFICGYIVLSKKRLRLLPFIVLLIVGGFFLSIFKVMGGLFGGNTGTVEAFNDSKDFLLDYATSKSLFIPTRELSYSIYVNNILFSFWSNGGSFYGAPLLIGLLKGIPGGILLCSIFIGVDINLFNLPTIAQEMVGAQHGLGNSCIAELLVSVGWSGTLIIVFLLGMVFSKLDWVIAHESKSLFWFTLTFSIFSMAFFIPRGSFFSVIGQSFIVYIVLLLNRQFSKIS